MALSDEPEDLQARVDLLSLWAKTSSLRALDMAVEWVAFGFGGAGIYLLFMAWRQRPFGLLDIAILVLIIVNGFIVAAFEVISGQALRQLGDKLAAWEDASSQLGGEPPSPLATAD